MKRITFTPNLTIHPIIRQLPLSVEKRLSSLSTSEAIFNDAKDHYQEALKRNGHTHQLRYNPPIARRRQRSRKVIRFNPPYSRTVETKIGKEFLKLVDKHFPRNSKFHKIFNRNTLKVSYGCMPNIGGIISSHNKKILGENKQLERGSCNCQRRYKGKCPLNGECLSGNVMYEAKVNSSERNYPEKTYIGITEPIFIGRLGNHERDFNNEEYINSTELSIKKKGYNYDLKWRIIKQLPTYNPSTKTCMLCTAEKMEILEGSDENLLNKRTELISRCRHKRKFLLNKYDVT